jgi:nitroreductase
LLSADAGLPSLWPRSSAIHPICRGRRQQGDKYFWLLLKNAQHGIRMDGSRQLLERGPQGTHVAGGRSMNQSQATPLSALDAIFMRRSVRAYEKRRLDESTIRSLLDAAVEAPTAMHMEPWAFVVVQDDAVLRRLSESAKASFAKEVLHRDLHARSAGAASGGFAARLADPEFSIFYDAGTLIVICAKPLGPFVVADCWLAAENLMLAACALGLGTCCIGAAVLALNTPEIKSELHIPADVTAVVPIVVGAPAGSAPEVARRDPDVLYWMK